MIGAEQHQVGAAHARQGGDAVQEFAGDGDAVATQVGALLQATAQVRGQHQAGHRIEHRQGPLRDHHGDPGQQEQAAMQILPAVGADEILEHRQVEHALGLDEIGAGGGLLQQAPQRHPLRAAEGVDRRTQERPGYALDGVAGEAHLPGFA